jgi:hypothetical protein
MTHGTEPHPPEAPDVPRRFRPARHHAIGLALLGLLVVASGAGAFGTTEGRADAEAAGLRLTVVYPERTRAKLERSLSVEVTNDGSADLATVVVAVDRRYLEGFSAVAFTPEIARIGREAYLLDLGDLAVGETRLVDVVLTAEALWGRDGFVEVTAGDAAARAEFRSFVFP